MKDIPEVRYFAKIARHKVVAQNSMARNVRIPKDLSHIENETQKSIYTPLQKAVPNFELDFFLHLRFFYFTCSTATSEWWM